ncbi:hypothetical protein GAPWKB11_1429 [Gilliamella apicola]|nr:hypothetical protein GAPWKB11_1429 [Gilliamella apicola]
MVIFTTHFNYIAVINGTSNDAQFDHYTFSTKTLKFINLIVCILINNGRDKLLFT